MITPRLNVSRRIRATPYTSCVESLGVSGYSVVNHTILPKGFQRTVEEDYWHLKKHVQLWDVGCQRQVEIKGPDAARLTQLMTPRDLSNARVGQGLYAPLIDQEAGMINDPIILKLGEDHFWLSIADSDVLLWAKGLGIGMGLDVKIQEPDVWPMAIQGPRSDDLVSRVFGDIVRNIRFFQFIWCHYKGHPLLISRSGYSKQGGFEIYLDKPEIGVDLWNALWEAGQEFNVSPGSPNLIERIEGGLLSYGNEMTNENNPLECGMDQYCQLDGSIDFIGYDALKSIKERGPDRRIRGVIFDGPACPPCQYPWPIKSSDGNSIGQVTSAIWSPDYQRNVALGMVEKVGWNPGTLVNVESSDGLVRPGIISGLPMSKNQ